MKTDTRFVRRYARQRSPHRYGYPLTLFLRDGGLLCPACARENIGLICRDTRYNIRSGWGALGCDVIWEGEESCDHCGSKLAVAYPSEETENG
jgi:hypothetical protein